MARLVAVWRDSSLSVPCMRSEESRARSQSLRAVSYSRSRSRTMARLNSVQATRIIAAPARLCKDSSAVSTFSASRSCPVSRKALPELQHCLEGGVIRRSVQLLTSVEEHPGFLDCAGLTIVHCSPTILSRRRF